MLELQPQPILKSDRLVLKEIDEDFYHDLFKYRNNRELCDLSGMDRDETIIDTIHFMNGINRNIYFNNFYYWGIFLKDDTLIGVISFSNIDKVLREGEFGYFIGFKYQRQGYMIEALKLVLNYLFVEQNFKNVHSYVDISNYPSQKLATKLKFKEVSRSMEEDMGGNKVEMYKFTLGKDDYIV